MAQRASAPTPVAAAPPPLRAAAVPSTPTRAVGATPLASPSALLDRSHLEFSEQLSRRVLASLRALNESLGEVRQSVAKIDTIAQQRLQITSSAPGENVPSRGAEGSPSTSTPSKHTHGTFYTATSAILSPAGVTRKYAATFSPAPAPAVGVDSDSKLSIGVRRLPAMTDTAPFTPPSVGAASVSSSTGSGSGREVVPPRLTPHSPAHRTAVPATTPLSSSSSSHRNNNSGGGGGLGSVGQHDNLHVHFAAGAQELPVAAVGGGDVNSPPEGPVSAAAHSSSSGGTESGEKEAATHPLPQVLAALKKLLLSDALRGCNVDPGVLRDLAASLHLDDAIVQEIQAHVAGGNRSLSPHSVRTHTPPPHAFHSADARTPNTHALSKSPATAKPTSGGGEGGDGSSSGGSSGEEELGGGSIRHAGGVGAVGPTRTHTRRVAGGGGVNAGGDDSDEDGSAPVSATVTPGDEDAQEERALAEAAAHKSLRSRPTGGASSSSSGSNHNTGSNGSGGGGASSYDSDSGDEDTDVEATSSASRGSHSMSAHNHHLRRVTSSTLLLDADLKSVEARLKAPESDTSSSSSAGGSILNPVPEASPQASRATLAQLAVNDNGGEVVLPGHSRARESSGGVLELNIASPPAPAASMITMLVPPPPSHAPTARPVPIPFIFPHYEESEGEGAYEDDGLEDDIPVAVADMSSHQFRAAEEEAAELKRMKAQLQAMKAVREAEKKQEGEKGAGATSGPVPAPSDSGSAGVVASASASALAGASVPLDDPWCVMDDCPSPRVLDWHGGDISWPFVADAEEGEGCGDSLNGSGEAPPTRRFEAFALRVVYEAGRTGFEEAKDFAAPIGAVIAGRYKVRDFLGAAAFSSAVACTDLVTSQEVCLKIIKNNKDFLDQSLDEIKLLRYINAQGDADAHNVLRLHEYFYHKEHLFLVTELLKDNLYEFQKYLSDAGEPEYFTLPRIQRITQHILEALAFIHSKGLVHCDLKPENILIKSYSKCEVKVIDFGSSCFITDHLSSYIQSRSYRAPEVILGLPYGTKIDVWSVGCILCELLTGKVLFANDSIQMMLTRMQSLLGAFPQKLLDEGREVNKYFTTKGAVYERSDAGGYSLLTPKRTNLRIRLKCDDVDFLNFVSALLTIDPDKRPTAAQALQHPWLAKPYELEPYVLPQ